MINGKLRYKEVNGSIEVYFSSYTDNGNDVHSIADAVHGSTTTTHLQNIATQTNAVFAVCTLAEGDEFIIHGLGDENEEEDYVKGVYTVASGAITATFEHNISTDIIQLT